MVVIAITWNQRGHPVGGSRVQMFRLCSVLPPRPKQEDSKRNVFSSQHTFQCCLWNYWMPAYFLPLDSEQCSLSTKPRSQLPINKSLPMY